MEGYYLNLICIIDKDPEDLSKDIFKEISQGLVNASRVNILEKMEAIRNIYERNV